MIMAKLTTRQNNTTEENKMIFKKATKVIQKLTNIERAEVIVIL